ncbi:type 4a pilus biogenesis protein PilO [Candidatus Parcubacteria bacterium]|nr:type 4a pilus biogenesis protein PilO [Candidatus Parcubacteria bacterium]MCG2701124.1 type 4a pilus biogenesis protein PilO [Candidatus Parcubacteria bacterium]
MQIENFIKYSLKKKIIIISAIFAAVICGIACLIIIPTVNDIKRIKAEVENQIAEMEKRYITGQSLKELKENLEKIDPELETLSKSFVVKGRELDFITALEELAYKNNVQQKINMDAFKNLDDSKTFQKIPLNLSAQGNFSNLMNYLVDLESLCYYININTLELPAASAKSFTANKIAGQESGIGIAISADAYWTDK